jgi:hypothetical protein
MAEATADETLSLYFELREGEKADLEVVAAAALAWVEGIRAAAKAIDPGADVRVEVVDAKESSLLLNNLVKWLETRVEPQLERIERGGERLKRTRKLAAGLAFFLLVTAPATWDLYFGDGDFTEEDRAALLELTELARQDESVQSARRKFYKSIERDPSITGVGVKERPDDKPIIVVPSDRFAEGGGLWDQEEFVQERTIFKELEVILVRPALTKTPRAWTFKIAGLPEFDATMRDPAVLRRGGLPEEMHDGITMIIRLKIEEELVDGEWRVARGGRSVDRVISPAVD